MSDYTDLYDIMRGDDFTPSKFFDTGREKYQADLLDEAEDVIAELKAERFLWMCAVIFFAVIAGLALGGVL